LQPNGFPIKKYNQDAQRYFQAIAGPTRRVIITLIALQAMTANGIAGNLITHLKLKK